MRTRLLSIIVISGLFIYANELIACVPPPIAILNGSPSETFVGDTINLDGSCSQYWCGNPLFEWDFHYDGSFDAERNTGDVSFTSYSYSTPGTYTIALRVRDGCGNYSPITSLCLFTVTVHNVIFVDKNATGSCNGSSWANAFNYLQDALSIASNGDKIWIAEGIYKPDADSGNPNGTGLRTATFQLPDGVALYGGFPTGGGSLSSRDWVNNETILSGDIGIEGEYYDNSYHVILGVSNTIIDGFTIAGGNADLAIGAGMQNILISNVIVSNCILKNNIAYYEGGGIYNFRSNVEIINCNFINNSAMRGGGIYNDQSPKIITNCSFTGNQAGQGGGIYNRSPTQKIQKINTCIFNYNTAQYGGGIWNEGDMFVSNSLFIWNFANSPGEVGGGIYHYGNGMYPMTVNNCTLFSNQCPTLGAGIMAHSQVNVTNSILWDNGSLYGAWFEDQIAGDFTLNNSCVEYYTPGDGGIGNTGQNPSFVNINDPNGPDNILGTTDDGLRLSSNSPCVNTGDNSFVLLETVTDIKGHARFNGIAVDMGVYEFGDININQDLDGDGMPDWFEFRYNFDPDYAGDAGLDGDSDGLTNVEEYRAGSNPTKPDSDDDTMPDKYEFENGLNPADDDRSEDLDNDGLTNFEEYGTTGTKPNNPDTDGDTMPDGYEVENGLNPIVDDRNEDPDRDDLVNLGEYEGGTDPNDWDTDNDLLADGWEIQYGLNPLVANDINGDADGDGLSLLGELKFRTNPVNPDTDGDGASDGVEVSQGSYPTYAADAGIAPSADAMCSLRLTVGDHSGSHSERYDMIIYRAGESSPFVIHHQGPEFGVVSSAVYNQFRAGERYEIKITWLGTNMTEPDYDYVAYVEPVSLPAGVKLVEEDPEDILTYDYHNQYPENLARCPYDQFWPEWPYVKKAYVNLIKTKITEPDGNPVTDNHFVFDSSSTGYCDVIATGTTGITQKDPDLEWSLTGIAGSTLTSNPSPPKGSNIAFTYAVLPASNSQFGPKTLTLTHPQGSQDSRTVEIFFHRDAYNHAGAGYGTTRNWHYYWKEGGVVSDLSQFDYDDSSGYGWYDSSTGQLAVCNLAPTSDSYTMTLRNRYYLTVVKSGTNGIANTSAIEDDVQVIPVGQGEPYQTAITAGANGVLDSNAAGDDVNMGAEITTGANGVCNTTAAGDDIQVISFNQGKPNSIIITAGPDNFMHSADAGHLSPDDQLDLSSAQTITLSVNFSGIECCAMTCKHEIKHKEIHNIGGTDSDGDHLPDSLENGVYNLDPYRKDTYDLEHAFHPDYKNYGDNELLARIAEQIPGPSYPGQDWSNINGQQWSN